MSRLIPVIYKNMKYPQHINATIHELSGNFYKEKLIIKSPYSLHTESSYNKIQFCSYIVNSLEHIKNAQKNNIPQLWYNENWADDFFKFIKNLVGNKPPEVLEIHPPYNDYCKSFDQFLKIFNVFYNQFKNEYAKTTILIENRYGTRIGCKFLLSSCSDILEFCKVLRNNQDIGLKIALDYPQLFSAEINKDRKKWDDIELVKDKIIKFNNDLKEYQEFIGGIHMWGKLKSEDGKIWKVHAGNLDTFFINNKKLKHEILNSIFTTFNDDRDRYFVPEVISGISDFHSIVADMEGEGFIFNK